MSLTTFTPKETMLGLSAMWRTDVAVFIWGSPGISKSSIMRSLASQRGYAYLDMRMSQMRPEDLRGIPYPVDYGGIKGLTWVAPYLLPRDLDWSEVVTMEAEQHLHKYWNPKSVVNDIYYCTSPTYTAKPLNKKHTAKVTPVMDEDGVSVMYDRCLIEIFDENGEITGGKVRISVRGKSYVVWALEEFNSANLAVQAAAYELVLEGRIGEYVKPKGAFLVAAGNLETDKGITYKLPTPVRNRFGHVFMIHNYKDWNEWAIDEGHIHPNVVGYLAAFSSELFKFEPTSDEKAFPTPRSWEFVSKILWNNDDMPERIVAGLIEGAIGGTGVTFMAFRRMAENLPKLDDILDGTLTNYSFDPENKMQLSTALVTAACYKLRDQIREIRKTAEYKTSSAYAEWMTRGDHFIGFMKQNMTPDVMTMGVRLATSTYELPFNSKHMPNLRAFTVEQGQRIMKARIA